MRQAKGLFRAYYEALAEELARGRASSGGEVKDLDTGLVDFPGKRGEEEILLCWQLGERRLGYWHTVEAGSRAASDRRPGPARAARAWTDATPIRKALRAAIEALLRACGLDPAHDPDLQRDAGARGASCGRPSSWPATTWIRRRSWAIRWWARPIPTWWWWAGLRFHSMCPHHLVPYRGVAHVAYLPAGQAGRLRAAGRSGRVLHQAADPAGARHPPDRRDALCSGLGARGAGCVIEAEQLCLALPGERHDQSGVVTSAFVGEMRERPDLKARLLAAANLGGRAR